MSKTLSGPDLVRAATEVIETQAATIKALKARLRENDPGALPRLNSPEEDIKRAPLVSDAIKQRLDNPSNTGANILGAAHLQRGAGTWEPETGLTKRARLNDGVQTKAEEDALKERIEKFRKHQHDIGGRLR